MRPPLPARSPLRTGDLLYAVALFLFAIVGLFARHNGFDRFATPAGTIEGVGRLSGLLGTGIALVGLFLMSRLPVIEQGIGPDRLSGIHRTFGFIAVYAVLLHAFASTLDWAHSLDAMPAKLVEIWTDDPGGNIAIIAAGLFLLIGFTSVSLIRRLIGYELWHTLHLSAYAALILSIPHQFTFGSALSLDPAGRAFWIGSFVFAAAPTLFYRFLTPLYRSVRYNFRVIAVVPESDDVVSIYLGGRHLDRLPHRSGQYFSLRFLTLDGWFRSHPFSLSQGPDGQTLRFTVKAQGGWTRRLRRMRPDTRVIVEGPYGVLHGGRRSRDRVLLIGGGIGITPMRALFETLPAEEGGIDLIYRASERKELLFRDELDAIARSRGGRVHYLVGRREELGADPLSGDELRRRIPDIVKRDIYLCGPERMMRSLHKTLRKIGVPASRIHLESFAW